MRYIKILDHSVRMANTTPLKQIYFSKANVACHTLTEIYKILKTCLCLTWAVFKFSLGPSPKQH